MINENRRTIELLSRITHEICNLTKVGLNDDAKYAEYIVRDILNRVSKHIYGSELSFQVAESVNEVGIDLIDDTRAFAIQVTTQDSKNKIENTLKSVLSTREHLENIKFIVIRDTLSRHKLDNDTKIASNRVFDIAKDYLTLIDLAKFIVKLEIENIEYLNEFLVSTITIVSEMSKQKNSQDINIFKKFTELLGWKSMVNFRDTSFGTGYKAENVYNLESFLSYLENNPYFKFQNADMQNKLKTLYASADVFLSKVNQNSTLENNGRISMIKPYRGGDPTPDNMKKFHKTLEEIDYKYCHKFIAAYDSFVTAGKDQFGIIEL